MSVTQLIRRWWTQSNTQDLLKSQDKLLKAFIRTPFHHTSSYGLNSVEFISSSATTTGGGDTTVILAHGFGSGLGFFFANVDSLLQHPSIRRVVLVDWMGMGGSDRPGCRAAPIRRWSSSSSSNNGGIFSGWCDSKFTTAQAVNFFIDPANEWIQQYDNGYDKLIISGHSLGGYLVARMITTHQPPTNLSRVILASPVGFAKKPTNTLTGSQLPTTIRIIDALWSRNVTPQQLVRLAGATRGRYSTRRALRGRIPHLNETSVELLADYLYHITVAPPSGEFAMNSLLEPVVSPDMMGVFAREPLEESFFAGLSDVAALSRVKVLYGDHDWMRVNEQSARDVMQRLPSQIKGSVDIIPGAGHHLYLDNSTEFVRHIVED